jgi:hypothetical protein
VAVSVQQQSPQQQVSSPSSERLHRLVVAAAGYRGIETGDPLPIDEIVEQGKANGYTEDEIRALIQREYGSTQTIAVPPQEDIFGEMWRVDETGIESNMGASEDGTIQRFREWLEERANNDKTHSYTRRKANKRFAKSKDVDRNFIRKYDSFSTILITYTQQKKSDQSIAEHADSFYSRKITRKRRRILKKQGAYDEAAILTVLAPKFDDEVPYANAPTTHAHDFIWITNDISEESFQRLKKLDGFNITVSIQHHISEEVETPPSVMERGSALDRKRGDTTALPQELGSNIPLLNCQFDARGAPEYVEEWCAHLRSGTDDSFKTNGIHRYRKLGTFDQRAAAEKCRQKIQSAHTKAARLCSMIEYHSPTPSPAMGEARDGTPEDDTEPKRIDSCNSASNKTPEEDTHTNTSDTNKSQFDFPEIADSDSVSDLITESQFEFTEGEGGGSVSETDTESQFEFTEGEDGGSVSETGTESQFDFIRLDEENNTNDSSSQFTFTAE